MALASRYGTYKTVKARLWPWLQGKTFSPHKISAMFSKSICAMFSKHPTHHASTNASTLGQGAGWVGCRLFDEDLLDGGAEHQGAPVLLHRFHLHLRDNIIRLSGLDWHICAMFSTGMRSIKVPPFFSIDFTCIEHNLRNWQTGQTKELLWQAARLPSYPSISPAFARPGNIIRFPARHVSRWQRFWERISR